MMRDQSVLIMRGDQSDVMQSVLVLVHLMQSVLVHLMQSVLVHLMQSVLVHLMQSVLVT